MKKLWILIVLVQIAYPAFENAFKFQYLGDNLPNFQDSVKTGLFKKSVVLIVPFSQPYLKIASMNFSHPFSAGIYELYLTSTGDKLYHEIMLENKFDFSIHNNYNLAVLMNSYLISIQNYSTYYTFSAGFRLAYSNPKYVSYFIEYKNGYFITQSNLNPDVPEIIHISFFQINYKSQFVFSLVKDMSFPVDIQLYPVDPKMNWLGQFRLLPKNWMTVSGHPTTGFGKSENEVGFLISMRKKLNGFTFFG